MEQINDIEIYNRRMQLAMKDKLWFMRYLSNGGILVDYGCADGTLLQFVHKKYPKILLIGVDNNPEMLSIAERRVPNAIFMSTEEFFDCNIDLSSATLVLSSVVHEIFSYEPDPVLEMKKLFEKEFKLIAIRDMFIYDSLRYIQSDKADLIKICQLSNPYQVISFENRWGSLSKQNNLVHYLLKYKYVENWNREVAENYFPISVQRLINDIVPSEYRVRRLKQYTLPYIRKCVRQDFGIKLREHTHAKILLVRRQS